MKVGDLVKIFAASKHPPALVIGDVDKHEVLILFNNKLSWVRKNNLEALSENR